MFRFIQAFWHHEKDDLLNLYAQAEDISWHAPVGTPPHVGLAAISKRKDAIPEVDYVKLHEIFYTMSDKIFSFKMEIQLKNYGKPFVVLERLSLDGWDEKEEKAEN